MKKVIMLIGIQGAGKSTYCKKLEESDSTIKKLSMDDIRFLLFDLNTYHEKFDENHEKFNNNLDDIYGMSIETILNQNLTLVLDECHHLPTTRRDTMAALRNMYDDIVIEAHYLYDRFESCHHRNMQRRPEQIVPYDIVKKFHDDMIAGFNYNTDVGKITSCLIHEGFDIVETIDAFKLLNN